MDFNAKSDQEDLVVSAIREAMRQGVGPPSVGSTQANRLIITDLAPTELRCTTTSPPTAIDPRVMPMVSFRARVEGDHSLEAHVGGC